MADETGVKVSQLPLGENLADDDLMYAVESGISKKVEVSYLQNRIVGDVDSTPTADSGNLVSSGGVYNMVHTLDFNVFHNLAQISNSIADAFSASESYSEGDYVVYDYNLYKFTADKSAGAWDSSKATPVAVVEEIGSGGTTVVPNPSGEATDTLEKLQIDQTIYDFATSNVYGEASGAIASFSDGSANPLVKLEADINPIQDLHGYDKPWAGGAGKNKLVPSNAINTTLNGITFKTSGDGVYEISGTATAGTNCEFTFSQATSLVSGKKLSFFNNFTGYNLFFRKDGADKTYYNFSSANRTVTIAAADAVEFDTLRIMVESGATINGKFALMMYEGDTTTTYEPYSNICPISGRSSVEVTVEGKNLFDISQFAETYPSYCSYENDTLSVTGNSVLYTTGITVNIKAPATLNGTITNVTSVGAKFRLTYADETSQSISILPFTTTKDIVAVKLDWSTNGTFTISNAQIELGSTATSYEAYNADTETISLGQTVYGGKLNVTTGELTVTHKKAVIDEDTNITIGSSGMPFKAEVLTGVEPVSSSSQLTGTICDSLNEVTQASTWGTEYTFARVSTTELVYFKLDNATTTIEQCKEYLQNNPLSFVYKLKEENYITYNLTPTQVSSLLGSNNIWADSGDVDVLYIRDLNLFLNQLDARVKALENA